MYSYKDVDLQPLPVSRQNERLQKIIFTRLKASFAIHKRLNRAEILIRNYFSYLHSVSSYTGTKTSFSQNARSSSILGFIVAGINTRRTRFIRRRFGLENVENETDK